MQALQDQKLSRSRRPEGSLNNLLLIDRGVHFYQGLLTELHNDPETGTISPCETAEDALAQRLEGGYAAVLINAATLPPREALRLTREITQRHPGVRVLVFGLATAIEGVLEFIEAGADGYVRGTQSVHAIAEALRDMLRGEAVLCPDIAAALMGRIAHLAGYRAAKGSDGNSPDPSAPLSQRQREVLGMLQRGMSNAEIAVELCIEVGTVKNHVHHLLAKLNVSNRQAAAAVASNPLDFDQEPGF
jgi:DNA-binding NarL/FixJ family response regulator